MKYALKLMHRRPFLRGEAENIEFRGVTPERIWQNHEGLNVSFPEDIALPIFVGRQLFYEGFVVVSAEKQKDVISLAAYHGEALLYHGGDAQVCEQEAC